MLVTLGVKRENIYLCDLYGLVHEGRNEDMTPQKSAFTQAGEARTLGDVIDNADLFLGLSGPNVLTGDMVSRMASKPIVFALANPDPEIPPKTSEPCSPARLWQLGAPIIQTRSTYCVSRSSSRRIGCWCQRNQRADDAARVEGIAEPHAPRHPSKPRRPIRARSCALVLIT